MSVDRDLLHVVLGMRANGRGLLRISQAELAADLQITSRSTMSRILSAMVGEGRLQRVGHEYHAALYQVIDHDQWKAAREEQT